MRANQHKYFVIIFPYLFFIILHCRTKIHSNDALNSLDISQPILLRGKTVDSFFLIKHFNISVLMLKFVNEFVCFITIARYS